VTESLDSSASTLHKQWAKLEDEHDELARTIEAAQASGVDITPMRNRQASLLLKINSLVAEIRDAPVTTTEDFLALLDVALEHELDLACDIAFYGSADYPMISRLFRALLRTAPGFEFNSLRRWLSLGQLRGLLGEPTLVGPTRGDASAFEVGAEEIRLADAAR
jgi:hypothetical protein